MSVCVALIAAWEIGLTHDRPGERAFLWLWENICVRARTENRSVDLGVPLSAGKYATTGASDEKKGGRTRDKSGRTQHTRSYQTKSLGPQKHPLNNFLTPPRYTRKGPLIRKNDCKLPRHDLRCTLTQGENCAPSLKRTTDNLATTSTRHSLNPRK